MKHTIEAQENIASQMKNQIKNVMVYDQKIIDKNNVSL